MRSSPSRSRLDRLPRAQAKIDREVQLRVAAVETSADGFRKLGVLFFAPAAARSGDGMRRLARLERRNPMRTASRSATGKLVISGPMSSCRGFGREGAATPIACYHREMKHAVGPIDWTGVAPELRSNRSMRALS